jgi:uncharacterized protein YdeI (YjbR/CyaY-like superfamily)
MKKEAIDVFCPKNQREWRQWLQKNHSSKQSIWLIHYKKKTNVSSISWSQAVDQALCFGWIDSIRKPIDDEKFMQFFSQRKPNGTWSKVNKEKIKHFIEAGLMTFAGYKSIETAKQNGSWIILDEVEALIIPKDLEKEFKSKLGSKDFFLSLSTSVKKTILQWLVLAKKPETRQKRIKEIADFASQKLKPRQFR